MLSGFSAAFIHHGAMSDEKVSHPPENPDPADAVPAEAATTEMEPSAPPPGTPADETGEDADGPPPSAAAPTSTPAEGPRRGVLVPTWALIGVGVLLVAVAGFGLGRWTDGSGRDQRGRSAQQDGGFVRPGPRGGPGSQGLPNGNGNQGNGGQLPDRGGNATPPTPSTPSTPSTQTAFLGVSVRNPSSGNGAEIASVASGGPAATAGLQVGDVIVRIDNTSLTSATDLAPQITAHQPGDQVTVSYTRNGSAASVKVTLGQRPAGN